MKEEMIWSKEYEFLENTKELFSCFDFKSGDILSKFVFLSPNLTVLP